MAGVTNFTLMRDAHELKPGANREALIEGQLDECQLDERPNLPRTGIVPDSGDHLGGSGVPKVEIFYEGEHVGGVPRLPSVFVSPFGGVAKKGGVPKGWGSLPMPLPWVPWEVLDEPCFKDPKEKGFLTWCRRVPSYLES